MTQSNPLRVGLIGAGGRWGPRAHAPALKDLPEAELYAVCTAHADTAQAAADKFGVKRATATTKRWAPIRRSKPGGRGARAGAL